MKNIFNFKMSILIIIISAFTYNCLYAQKISYGDSLSLWSGTIKNWIKTDSAGSPQGVGFTFTENALKNLPSQTTFTNSLDFPKNATDTLFSHMQFIFLPSAWEFGIPAFTDHIFIISKQEQEAITGGPDTFQVDPQFIPQDYVSNGFITSQAGSHWYDETGPENHGEPLTKSLLYGYSKGKISFYEITASKAYLETHPHFAGDIKQPEKFHKKGYYPTAYKIEYDTVKRVFNYELTDFILRQAAITGIEDSWNKNIPDKFGLYQNYPNPFNPTTTIIYSIPKTSIVILKVFDILGREVAKLVNEEKPAGSYQVEFTATNLTSGVYFYRITSGNFVSTKKFIISK